MASRLFRSSDTAQLLAALWSVIVEMENTSTPALPSESDDPSVSDTRKAPSRREPDLRRQALTQQRSAKPSAVPSTPPAARSVLGTPSSTGSVYSTPSLADDGFEPFLSSSSVSRNNGEMSDQDAIKATAKQDPLQILAQIETDTDLDSMDLAHLQSAYAQMETKVKLLKRLIPDLVESFQEVSSDADELARFRAYQTLHRIGSGIAHEQAKKANIPGSVRRPDLFYGFSEAQTDQVVALFQAMADIAKKYVTVDMATHRLRMNNVKAYIFEKKDQLGQRTFDDVIKALDEHAKTGTKESKDTLDNYSVVREAYKRFDEFRSDPNQNGEFRTQRFNVMVALFRQIDLAALQKEANQLRVLVEQSQVLIQNPEHNVAAALLLLNCYFYVASKVKLNP